jgi:tetratricopeptide (TPR) repeat protein
MIVRDAEETVGRAIKSALAVVDEVVVVDTGSADNTRLIVEGYGARVVEHTWNDDFAAARNASIGAAYGDWILILDADEVLETIRPVEIGRLLSNDRALAYFVSVSERAEDGTQISCDQIRLFRNHPQARYCYPVHEQITPALAALAGEQGRGFLPSRLSVLHRDAGSHVAQERKARNQRLLQRAIADHAEEPWFHYQLARENAVVFEDQLLPVKGFSETLELLETAVRQVRRQPAERLMMLGYVTDLFCLHASALIAAGRFAGAVAISEEAQRLCGDGPLLRYTHARALIDRAAEVDDSTEVDALLTIASSHLHVLLRGEAERDQAPVSEHYFSAYPRAQLGRIALARGDYEAAGDCFREAMRACPEYTAALCGLAALARAEGRVQAALQIYLKVLEVDDRDVAAWIGGAETQIELGFEDNARSWLGRLEQFLPEHPALPALFGQISPAARPADAAS